MGTRARVRVVVMYTHPDSSDWLPRSYELQPKKSWWLVEHEGCPNLFILGVVDVHDDLMWMCKFNPLLAPPGRGDLGTPQYTVLIWQNAAKKPQNWSFL